MLLSRRGITDNEDKAKWKKYMISQKNYIKIRQNIFVKTSCDSLSTKKAPYKLPMVSEKKRKPFSYGEEVGDSCLQNICKIFWCYKYWKKSIRNRSVKVKVTRRIKNFLKIYLNKRKILSVLVLILWICWHIDAAQLSIFIRAIDYKFNIFEE